MKFNHGQFFELIVSAALLKAAVCSPGDRSSLFQDCIRTNNHHCVGQNYPNVLPWWLRIFGWDCLDELKYQCMHNTTEILSESGNPVYQFYGKWPFIRLLGIQEPASTFFSIGNLLAHVIGWKAFSKAVSRDYIFHNGAKMFFLINVNAWFWSSIFHTRDLNLTEKMDYFCATLVVLSSILFCFMRIVGKPNDRRCILFGSSLVALFAYHVYTMGFVKFHYGYNMKFNVCIGTINVIMWLCWCFLKRKERPYVWKCAAVNISTYLFVGLELFDFPPLWWTFDAHSLWHLATILPSYFWYSFLISDGTHEILLSKRL